MRTTWLAIGPALLLAGFGSLIAAEPTSPGFPPTDKNRVVYIHHGNGAEPPAPAPLPNTPTGVSTSPAIQPSNPYPDCGTTSPCREDCRKDSFPTGFFVDGSLYIIRPAFTANPAYTTFNVNRPTPRDVTAGNVTQEFDWNYQPAYSLRAGWLGEAGLGLRAGFFQFDQASDNLQSLYTPADLAAGKKISPPILGLPGPGAGVASFGAPGALLPLGLGQDQLSFLNSLTLYAVDMEAIGQTTWGPCQLLISGGARYLRLEQNYNASLNNPGGAGASEGQSLQAERAFTGAGPTICLEANRKLGGSRFGLFGNVRGSYLLGKMHEQSNFQQQILDPGNVTITGPQVTQTAASFSRLMGLPVTEFEIGGEFRTRLSMASLLVQLSAVSMTYFEAGSATSGAGNLTLFGGKLSAGLTY